ncbi:MAG: PAS domain-containing protein [Rhizobiaceae bacterium]|nr:PAS domain-containing protein [Rhizobiaceae bacterium]
MTETTPEGRARRWRAILAGRLRRSRWVLLAALAACLVLAVAGGVAPWVTAVAAAVVMVSAALPAPRLPASSAADGAGAEDGDLAALSAGQLAAAVPDPLVIFDRRGIVLHANAAASATFAVRPGLVLAMKFRAPEMQALIAEVLDEGTGTGVVDYVERVPLERFFRVTATPLGDGAGLFALLFKDQGEARRIDRMRADFIANASHELRTPLASIAGFIETLRGPARDDPAAREQFLSIMHDQTGRMARLIDDLLSLSRLEMKPLNPGGMPVDLAETVDAVIGSLSPLAADVGVEVVRRYPGGGVDVPGSRDELFQVFENLLENACKYGRGGGKVEVTIAVDRALGEAMVSFRDFGPGIAEEHIPRVTERFYRVDVETSRGQKGTGLGLAIVKHILTRHGGRLTIRSTPGEGAEFTAHLPLGSR